MKKTLNKIILLLLLLSPCVTTVAQDLITFKGKITDAKNNAPLYYSIIVNKRTNTGVTSNVDGTFTIQVLKTDTLLISSSGYALRKLPVSKALEQIVMNGSTADATIAMNNLQYTLRGITIKPDIDLEDFKKQLKKIKTPEADKYAKASSFANAFQSPITYLYETFNRLEKSKRLVEQLTNDDNRLELRRALFKTYMFENYEVLNPNQLDAFIRFCNFTDGYIKQSTEYELASAIKKNYYAYTNQNDYVKFRN
ncbi:MAG: carboxypeptidase-like regulatory domain-containing protein [Bacteroidia bacterium]